VKTKCKKGNHSPYHKDMNYLAIRFHEVYAGFIEHWKWSSRVE